jgi:HSP20 family protein
MFATRWEPLAEMNRLRNEMDRLFGRWTGVQPVPLGQSPYPPLNIWEDDDNLYVEAELPGFELNDLEIYVTGGRQLSIKGERKSPELQGGTWHRRERAFGSFNRMIDLTSSVDSDNVSAEFRHGVLTITLAKSAELKPRRIEVKAEGK